MLLEFVIAASTVTLVLAWIYGKLSDSETSDSNNPIQAGLKLLFFSCTLVSVLFLGFSSWYALQPVTTTTLHAYYPANQSLYGVSGNITQQTTVQVLNTTSVTTSYTGFQTATEGWLSMLGLLIWLPLFFLLIALTMYSLVWLYNWYKAKNKPIDVFNEEPRV